SYVRPAAPVPPSWPIGDAYLARSEAALPVVSYRDIFRDERLQALIEQALVNNRDLRVAAANIAAARAQVRVVRARQFPEVAAGGSATIASEGADRYAADIGIPAFELDLFGRLANATAAERDRA